MAKANVVGVFLNDELAHLSNYPEFYLYGSGTVTLTENNILLLPIRYITETKKVLWKLRSYVNEVDIPSPFSHHQYIATFSYIIYDIFGGRSGSGLKMSPNVLKFHRFS